MEEGRDTLRNVMLHKCSRNATRAQRVRRHCSGRLAVLAEVFFSRRNIMMQICCRYVSAYTLNRILI